MARLHILFAVLVAVAVSALTPVARVLAAPDAQDDWVVLTYPDPGYTKTYCYGLNDRGDAVGYYQTPSSRAYLLSSGTYVDLHAFLAALFNATATSAWGINARGDIVGDYYVLGTQEHGFLLRDGEVATIDFPGAAMVHPRAINARGDIAGFSMALNTSTSWQAFVLEKDGTLIDVTYPSAIYTSAFGINERGDVVGEYKDPSGSIHGFLRTRDGEFTALDYPGASDSRRGSANGTSAWKVNARGEITGYYWDTQTPSISHGFVWRQGEFRPDDYPGAIHTMNHGLNNRGDVCGMMSFTPSGPIQWGGFVHAR